VTAKQHDTKSRKRGHSPEAETADASATCRPSSLALVPGMASSVAPWQLCRTPYMLHPLPPAYTSNTIAKWCLMTDAVRSTGWFSISDLLEDKYAVQPAQFPLRWSDCLFVIIDSMVFQIFAQL